MYRMVGFRSVLDGASRGKGHEAWDMRRYGRLENRAVRLLGRVTGVMWAPHCLADWLPPHQMEQPALPGFWSESTGQQRQRRRRLL